MGTLKVDSKPQRSSSSSGAPRSSITGPQASAKKSRLPTLAAKSTISSASKNRGRSGSMERRNEPVSRVSAALGSIGASSFKTPRNSLPRNKSGLNRTPTSNRQPLANLHSNGPKRSSIYGRSSISSKHNKENRPLNDRDWQKDVVRELVGFCINNGYQNAALSTKDFHPINTTTFRSVIEFLYGFLVPSFSLPPPKVTPVHEILTEILKKMNYPGTVSKSLKISRPICVSNPLLSWPFRRLPRPTWLDYSRIPTYAPSMPRGSPSCLRTSNLPDVSVGNVPRESTKVFQHSPFVGWFAKETYKNHRLFSRPLQIFKTYLCINVA